jgi:hypothetical protein
MFYLRNEKGEVVDESGNEHFEMDFDTEAYPVDYITNCDEHLDCKSLEKKKEKENLTMKNEAHMRILIKKMKMKFVHTGNMIMLSKNNYFS